MKKLAIAFFHMGVSQYQKYTLDLAVKRNPGSDVVLITDSPLEEYPDGVCVCDMSQYSKLTKDIDGIYQHRNTCQRHFNFRGILRWIVYNEWWKSNTEYDIFVADSDVMIFSDLSKERDNWKKFSHTLSMGTAGGQSFWFNRVAMQHLVDIIWNTYRNPDSESARHILSHFDNLQRNGLAGGVCDMTFLKASAECLNLPVGETTDIVNNSTYDHNILMPQGYVFDSQRKKVEWIDGVPYCRIEKSETEQIRFHTLHMSCSGGLIEEYYNKAMGVAV